MVNSAAHALDRRSVVGTVDAAGDVVVSASDTATIDAHTTALRRGLADERRRRRDPEPASSARCSTTTTSRATRARSSCTSATRCAPTTAPSTSSWARTPRSTSTRPRRTTPTTATGSRSSEPNLITDARRVRGAVDARHGARSNDGLTGAPTATSGSIDHNDVRSEVARVDHGHAGHRGRRRHASRALEAASLSPSTTASSQTWEGNGAVIVTNVVLSSAGPGSRARRSTPASVVGRRRQHRRRSTATATSKIEGFDKSLRRRRRCSTRSAGSRRTSSSTRRRAARRPADLERVRRRADAVRRAGVDPRHASPSTGDVIGDRHPGRAADGDGRQRGHSPTPSSTRCCSSGSATDGVSRRRRARLEQGQHPGEGVHRVHRRGRARSTRAAT